MSKNLNSKADHMLKIALIGSGLSAKKFLTSKYGEVNFDLFTTSGEGQIYGVQALPLNNLIIENYDKIYVAVYDFTEILKYFEGCWSDKIYWYDSLKSKIIHLKDPFMDFNEKFPEKIDTLTVLYDLRISPPTYDFLIFLVKAELVRKEKKLQWIQVIIIPGDKNGFRENISFFSTNEMIDRVYNLMLPLIKIVNNHSSIFLSPSRYEGRRMYESAIHKFPNNHNFAQPVARHHYNELFQYISSGTEHRILEADKSYVKRVKDWYSDREISKDKLVVITLRESKAHTQRNSDLNLWKEVCAFLVKSKFDVVILRDTSMCHLKLNWPGTHVSPLASLNVFYRQAVYETCLFNILVSSGPVSLNLLSKNSNFLLFGMHEPSCTSNTYEHLEKIGFKKDEQIIGAGHHQRCSWKPLIYSDVVWEINQYLEKTLKI